MELWIDDQKPAPSGVEWAKTYDAGLERLMKGDVTVLYLDYDLGGFGNNGPNLLREYFEKTGNVPDDVRGISTNPSGRTLVEETAAQLRPLVRIPEEPVFVPKVVATVLGDGWVEYALNPDEARSQLLVSSVRVRVQYQHAHLRVWNRGGGCSDHPLVVNASDADALVCRLLACTQDQLDTAKGTIKVG